MIWFLQAKVPLLYRLPLMVNGTVKVIMPASSLQCSEELMESLSFAFHESVLNEVGENPDFVI